MSGLGNGNRMLNVAPIRAGGGLKEGKKQPRPEFLLLSLQSQTVLLFAICVPHWT